MSGRNPWTVKAVQDAESAIVDILRRGGADDRQQLAAAGDLVRSGYGSSNDGDLLKSVLLNILILELHVRVDALSPHDVAKLVADTRAMLRVSGVLPGSTRLGSLHARIHRALAADHERRGNVFAAATDFRLACRLLPAGEAAESVTDILVHARHLLGLGHAKQALSLALPLAERRQGGPEAVALAVAAGRAAGEVVAVRPYADAAATGRESGDDALAWEAVKLALSAEANAAPAVQRIMRNKSAPLEVVLHTKLWIFASGSRSLRQAAPKAVSVRRRESLSEAALKSLKAPMQVVQALDEAYDPETPLAARLELVAEQVARRGDLRSPEWEMLLLAGALRHAKYYSQFAFVELYAAEYRAACLRLSDGANADLMGGRHVGSVDAAPAPVKTKWARYGKTLGLSARLAGVALKSKFQGLGADAAAAVLGRLAAEKLGSLRGGIMKLGQHLSTDQSLPAEVRDALASLRDAALPSPGVEVAAVLAAEYGALDGWFASVDPEPFAVGSIGQVHRGVLATGEEVVLKIQHPGIEDAVRSDLKMIRLLEPVAQRVMPATDMRAMFDELDVRLLAELDYAREARVQASFAALFADDADVKVPKVYSTHCRPRVLVSEYVRGTRYQDFIESAPAPTKQRAGDVIARMVGRAFAERGLFNGDPHPGNYLFLDDGRVCFVDFGCTVEWDRQFVDRWLGVLGALGRGDRAAFAAAVSAIGYDRVDPTFDMDEHWKLARTMHEPLLSGRPFAIDRAFVEAVTKLHTESPNARKASPPAEALLMIRVAFGLLNVLCELGVVADWRDPVMGVLDPTADLDAG